MHATFNLNGKLFMCSDSPPIHKVHFRMSYIEKSNILRETTKYHE